MAQFIKSKEPQPYKINQFSNIKGSTTYSTTEITKSDKMANNDKSKYDDDDNNKHF